MKLVIFDNEEIFKITEEQETILRYIRNCDIPSDAIDIIDLDNVEDLSTQIQEKF